MEQQQHPAEVMGASSFTEDALPHAAHPDPTSTPSEDHDDGLHLG